MRRVATFVACALLTGCISIAMGPAQGPQGSAGSATSGQGPQPNDPTAIYCDVPTNCPSIDPVPFAPPFLCITRGCVKNICAIVSQNEGMACGGNYFCDGNGQCVP